LVCDIIILYANNGGRVGNPDINGFGKGRLVRDEWLGGYVAEFDIVPDELADSSMSANHWGH
jgi:hypothetical protein